MDHTTTTPPLVQGGQGRSAKELDKEFRFLAYAIRRAFRAFRGA